MSRLFLGAFGDPVLVRRALTLGVSLVVVCRYDPGGATATVMGVWSEFPHPFQAGTRWPLDGPGLAVQMLKTGRPARIDDFTGIPGTIAARLSVLRVLSGRF